MILIAVLGNLSTSSPHGRVRMDSHPLQLLPNLEVQLEYPGDIPRDILSAAEVVVILLVPAFAQKGVLIKRALVEFTEAKVRISLYQGEGTLEKTYSLPLDALLDAVKTAQQQMANPEADLKQWALRELDMVFREHKLW